MKASLVQLLHKGPRRSTKFHKETPPYIALMMPVVQLLHKAAKVHKKATLYRCGHRCRMMATIAMII